MAFSYGFFNAKNLDRTYTAENFCDYLGSIICNGIQDNYGGCFKPTASKLKLAIASGKAWIDGHYFISDTAYTFDLSKYVDESLPRYISIGICCNTDESYRKIEFEISVGTPATNPTIPRFTNTDTKTYLTLCTVKIDADAIELQVTDYRENPSYCGYVRCILGKCKVTEMLSEMSEIKEQIKDYQNTIAQLNTQVTELTTEIEQVTGDVLSFGKCGDNIYYTLYSNGNLILRGFGAMYDYEYGTSPFYEDDRIHAVLLSEGISKVSAYSFLGCDFLIKAILPSTLKTISENGFQPHIDPYAVHQTLNGLQTLNLPNGLQTIEKHAFWGVAIQQLKIPESVENIGEEAFSECQNLETVRMAGSMIGEKMFARCIKLKNLTITKNCKQINSHCFNYCESLQTITYEGSIADWNAVKKQSNWDGHTMQTTETPLTKIICLDGYLEYDADTKTWNEVKA